MRAWLLVLLLLCAAPSAATDLGRFGRTYEIAERDLLELIEARLKALEASGELEVLQARFGASVKERLRRPRGVTLPRATRARARSYDPSITVPADILDADGALLVAAGTRVNPLDSVSLTTPLLFFDGDDEAQRRWARTLLDGAPHDFVPVLTNGPVLELMETWRAPLYFDQGGIYVRKLGLEALPVIVRQDGRQLAIEEVALP